jgi:hypothetical protein
MEYAIFFSMIFIVEQSTRTRHGLTSDFLVFRGWSHFFSWFYFTKCLNILKISYTTACISETIWIFRWEIRMKMVFYLFRLILIATPAALVNLKGLVLFSNFHGKYCFKRCLSFLYLDQRHEQLKRQVLF